MSLQPNLDPANPSLVQREGVNAASDRSTTEDADLIPAPVASEADDTAARPTSADDENANDRVAGDGHSIGAPARLVGGGRPSRKVDETEDAFAPASDAADAGQDNGSMS